ncbi:MAG: hypothetical protein ACTHM6_05855 [Tepidisphaeraceae bacterium]
MNAFTESFSELFSESAETHESVLGNGQQLLLWGLGLVAFVVLRWVFAALNIPALPHESSLLTVDQPFYAIILAGLGLVVVAAAARPLVARVRSDAPLFAATLGLLAIPTRGGDIRNALLDASSAGVFLQMGFELLLLWCFVTIASYVSRPRLAGVAPAERDTVADRLTAIGAQGLATLVLLTLIGQSPLKGQAIVGVGVAGLLATLIVHQSYRVAGSICYVTGTMLAGLAAYLWCFFHPAGLALGDTSGLFAGAARSLPLHYATAGVAGTLYGYWIGGSWHASDETDSPEPSSPVETSPVAPSPSATSIAPTPQ